MSDSSATVTTSTGTGTGTGSGNTNIRVLCRVRPSSDYEKSIASHTCINVHTSSNTVEVLSKPESKLFTYDVAADHTTAQHTVFLSAGKPITDTCLAGYNGTIFGYGQTG